MTRFLFLGWLLTSVCCASGKGGGVTDVVSVRVEPATATLDSVDGAAVSQPFALIGVQRDGRERQLPSAAWALDSLRVGSIDASGLFSADGSTGGDSIVTGSIVLGAATLFGTAHAIVNVHRTLLGAGVGPNVVDLFDGQPVDVDPASSIDVLYPIEGAVMPANVYPPAIQWAPVGSVGDFFRVTVARPHATVVAILANDGVFPHGWPADASLWRTIADSDPDDDIRITVDRLEPPTNRIIGGLPRTMRLARGSLSGAVYYEDRSSAGARVMRIHAVTAALEIVVPNPPPDPTTGERCFACHALTRDGRYIWGVQVGAINSVSYDLTTDLSGDSPPPRYPPTPIGGDVASFDPTGTYFVAGTMWSGPLAIFDATTSAAVASTGLPGAGSAYPSWSPDGMHIAFVGDVPLGNDIENAAGGPLVGNVYVADRADAAALDFVAPRIVHVGSSLAATPEGGASDTHPTWSPDSRFVAFQHGTRPFTWAPNPGALYLLDTDGAVHRLDNASGPSGTDGYWPTFAPDITREAGDRSYYWLAFYARRDYGNAMLGTQGTGVKQLWVVAIDANPDQPGADPSFVPYWLPGQNIRTSNMSAFWAVDVPQ